MDAYPHDPLALQAKGAIDATLLFEEGQARMKGGKYETARLAFETLTAVYPDNPLVSRAKSAVEAIDGKEKSTRPVVKSMEFRDVDVVPVDEIRAAMNAREVRLSVGQPCRSKDVQQAKEALEEILAEKGLTHVRVEAQTHAVPPDAVAVVFTVEEIARFVTAFAVASGNGGLAARSSTA
ncbi:MAG: POTRA domain-containing protein [Ignavibacteriota bacterium]